MKILKRNKLCTVADDANEYVCSLALKVGGGGLRIE